MRIGMGECQPSISICVPAYNEEDSLRGAVEDLITTLSPCLRQIEVIIVDDGSTDLTPQIAKQLASSYHQVKFIQHKVNSGIGVCYRDALAVAGADYFSWFPADHENSAEEFISCLEYLGQDKIVICNHCQQDPRTFLRRLLSRGYTWLLNKYFCLNLEYYNGLAVFPTHILHSHSFIARGFAVFAEILIRTRHSGCQIVELKAPLNKRRIGRSKALSPKAAVQMLKDALHIVINKNTNPR